MDKRTTGKLAFPYVVSALVLSACSLGAGNYISATTVASGDYKVLANCVLRSALDSNNALYSRAVSQTLNSPDEIRLREDDAQYGFLYWMLTFAPGDKGSTKITFTQLPSMLQPKGYEWNHYLKEAVSGCGAITAPLTYTVEN